MSANRHDIGLSFSTSLKRHKTRKQLVRILAVKSVILKKIKLPQKDPETGRMFSQLPPVSLKRDKKQMQQLMGTTTLKIDDYA